MKNIELLKEVGVDYQQGLSRFCNKESLYEKYLARFLEEPSYQALENAMSKKEYKTAFEAGHTLKGVCGNLSINSLFDSLEPFVNALRNSTDIDTAVKMFPKIQNSYKSAKVAIAKYFEEE